MKRTRRKLAKKRMILSCLIMMVTTVAGGRRQSPEWEILEDGVTVKHIGSDCNTTRVVVGENSSLVLETVGLGSEYQGGMKCSNTVKAASTNCTLLMECEKFQLQPPNSLGNCPDFLRIKTKDGADKKYCGEDHELVNSHNLGSKTTITLKTNKNKNHYEGTRCLVSCCPNQYLSTTQVDLDFRIADSPPIQTCNRPNTNHEAVCGLRGPGKIVGGQKAEQYDYTWLALLTTRFDKKRSRQGEEEDRLRIQGLPSDQEPFCGGSLVSRQWVVTASHCTLLERSTGKPEPGKVRVVLGEFDRALHDEFVTVYKVEKMIRHPQYNKKNFDNDIALWKLEEKADIFYRSICLPQPGLGLQNPMTVAGWGLKHELDYTMAEKLQEVKVAVVGQETCRNALKPYPVTSNMLCAGGKKDQDACQGDSGGPLMGLHPAERQFYLAGVVSWGIGCGREGYYGVYTKVSHYRTWIDSFIRP